MSDKKCELSDCDVVMQTRRGLCKTHYRALMKYGDPYYRSEVDPKSSLIERVRFYGWTEVPGPLNTSCWDWNGSTRKGYGRINLKGKGLVVTRVVMEHNLGNPIPEGLLVRHKCDRPICINPEHLLLGTVKENAQDMVNRGRQPLLLGSENPSSILSEDQVLEIRRRKREGETGVKLSKEFGVSQSTISFVCSGKRWGHLEEGSDEA